MSSYSIVITEMLLLLFRFLRVSLLSPKVLNLFLIKLRGAPKIDLPLSMFSLANSFLTSLFSLVNLFLASLFSISTLLEGGTKTVVLAEEILGEEKSYPKPVRLDVDF